jgi:hypothetical protein
MSLFAVFFVSLGASLLTESISYFVLRRRTLNRKIRHQRHLLLGD